MESGRVVVFAARPVDEESVYSQNESDHQPQHQPQSAPRRGHQTYDDEADRQPSIPFLKIEVGIAEAGVASSISGCVDKLHQKHTESHSLEEVDTFEELFSTKASYLYYLHTTEQRLYNVVFSTPTFQSSLKALHAEEDAMLLSFHALRYLVWKGHSMTDEEFSELKDMVDKHLPWLRIPQQNSRQHGLVYRHPDDHLTITVGIITLRIHFEQKIADLQANGNFAVQSSQSLVQELQQLRDTYSSKNPEAYNRSKVAASKLSNTNLQDALVEQSKIVEPLLKKAEKHAEEIYSLREALHRMRKDRDNEEAKASAPNSPASVRSNSRFQGDDAQGNNYTRSIHTYEDSHRYSAYMDFNNEIIRQQSTLEREKSTLQDEKSTLENEKSTLENEKSTLEESKRQQKKELARVAREKSTLEREKSTLDREKSTLEESRRQQKQEQLQMKALSAKVEAQKLDLANSKIEQEEGLLRMEELLAKIEASKLDLEARERKVKAAEERLQKVEAPKLDLEASKSSTQAAEERREEIARAKAAEERREREVKAEEERREREAKAAEEKREAEAKAAEERREAKAAQDLSEAKADKWRREAKAARERREREAKAAEEQPKEAKPAGPRRVTGDSVSQRLQMFSQPGAIVQQPVISREGIQEQRRGLKAVQVDQPRPNPSTLTPVVKDQTSRVGALKGRFESAGSGPSPSPSVSDRLKNFQPSGAPVVRGRLNSRPPGDNKEDSSLPEPKPTWMRSHARRQSSIPRPSVRRSVVLSPSRLPQTLQTAQNQDDESDAALGATSPTRLPRPTKLHSQKNDPEPNSPTLSVANVPTTPVAAAPAVTASAASSTTHTASIAPTTSTTSIAPNIPTTPNAKTAPTPSAASPEEKVEWREFLVERFTGQTSLNKGEFHQAALPGPRSDEEIIRSPKPINKELARPELRPEIRSDYRPDPRKDHTYRARGPDLPSSNRSPDFERYAPAHLNNAPPVVRRQPSRVRGGGESAFFSQRLGESPTPSSNSSHRLHPGHDPRGVGNSKGKETAFGAARPSEEVQNMDDTHVDGAVENGQAKTDMRHIEFESPLKSPSAARSEGTKHLPTMQEMAVMRNRDGFVVGEGYEESITPPGVWTRMKNKWQFRKKSGGGPKV